MKNKFYISPSSSNVFFAASCSAVFLFSPLFPREKKCKKKYCLLHQFGGSLPSVNKLHIGDRLQLVSTKVILSL